MPTVTVYRHGGTSGLGNANAKPPKREECQGWSDHSIRRNLLFLFSVNEAGLNGLQGAALTLTVRDLPPTAVDWCLARDNFFKALRREGVHLCHWVTEWQARGVPHLHLAVYWPSGQSVPVQAIMTHWLRITAPWGSKPAGQHSSPIWDVLGWNQYTAKHAARGLRHYQRQADTMPATWRGASTGRMWGKLGEWPIIEPWKVSIDQPAYWAYRRLVRSWRLSQARSERVLLKDERGHSLGHVIVPNPRRIRSARGMLRCSHRQLSACRGVSEWLPQGVNLAFLANLASRGFDLESV